MHKHVICCQCVVPLLLHQVAGRGKSRAVHMRRAGLRCLRLAQVQLAPEFRLGICLAVVRHGSQCMQLQCWAQGMGRPTR